MEKKINLNFCNLISSSSNVDLDFEKKALIKAYDVNLEFAKIKIPFFEVRIIYSRAEFEKFWGSQTSDYVCAFTREGDITIFAYEIFDKETIWTKKDFLKTLVHEINHLFYRELRNEEYDPLWLSEGLATFFQHDRKKFKYKNNIKFERKDLEQSFENISIQGYQIFTQFVEYLIFDFGEVKILNLIDGLKCGSSLDSLFKKIYKKSFERLIYNGNKYHKTT